MKLIDKILFCLEKYPQTRNSDVLLTRSVWYEYHNSKIFKDLSGYPSVNLKDMMDLPREDHVKRLRAKIQNNKVNPRFLPTDLKVFKQRKILEKFWHEEMSPNNPARG